MMAVVLKQISLFDVKLIAYNRTLSGGPYPTDGLPHFWEEDLPFHRENQQDALEWIKGGYIDGVAPMNYTRDNADWNFDTDQWQLRLQGDIDIDPSGGARDRQVLGDAS